MKITPQTRPELIHVAALIVDIPIAMPIATPAL